jgi:hypothetical protein
MRYKVNKPNAQRYEWVITIKEHSILNDIKIPTKIEAPWMLENGPWTWLELEIDSVK